MNYDNNQIKQFAEWAANTANGFPKLNSINEPWTALKEMLEELHARRVNELSPEIRWCIGNTVYGRPSAVDLLERAERVIRETGDELDYSIDTRLPDLHSVRKLFVTETSEEPVITQKMINEASDIYDKVNAKNQACDPDAIVAVLLYAFRDAKGNQA
jgi:hypothetical protein